MKILILEDEKPALEQLMSQLWQIDEKIVICGTCNSVEESIKWLNHHPQPDLVIMDVQLSDGLSFNIFPSAPVNCPVIFTTAYDKYLMQAMEYNSIDYLLKPICEEKLRMALRKYNVLQSHFVNNNAHLLQVLSNQKKIISRILVKRGMEFQAIGVENIVYIFTEYKLVFVVDKDNRKHLAVKANLGDMEEELDKNLFFRANRKYIINANYIKKFKPYERCRLTVDLFVQPSESIVVSQDNATAFKKWLTQEDYYA